MPQPAHVRCTWSGVFGSPATAIEQWSFSLKTAGLPATIDGPALMARAEALRATYADKVLELVPAAVVCTQTLYAVTGADGKVLRFPDGAYQQGKLAVEMAGGGSTVGRLPLQTALVVSTNTARPGQTGKGRLFLPLQLSQHIQTDFRIDPEWALLVAQRFAGVVHDVNALGPVVSVVSSKGYSSPVTSVRVGRAPDTMRSRREKVVEGYVLSPLP